MGLPGPSQPPLMPAMAVGGNAYTRPSGQPMPSRQDAICAVSSPCDQRQQIQQPGRGGLCVKRQGREPRTQRPCAHPRSARSLGSFPTGHTLWASVVPVVRVMPCSLLLMVAWRPCCPQQARSPSERATAQHLHARMWPIQTPNPSSGVGI